MTVSSPLPRHLTVLVLAGALAGCTTLNDVLSGDKIDYRSGAAKTNGLEVPPDLTQLAREGRYQPPAPVVSAAATGTPAAGVPSAATPNVAAVQVGDARLKRDGNVRWLWVPQPPEAVWPQVRDFWLEQGFTLDLEDATLGIIETAWAENRARLPQDLLRRTLGQLIDNLYDTGQRDRYRTRLERGTDGGTAIYVTHRAVVEEFADRLKESTHWVPAPSDPSLEAEFLARLMVRLGTPEAVARTQVAQPAATSGAAERRARRVAGAATPTLEIDDDFDRAWRRVGLALDRSGFTVEDRNRSQGLYFVRYVGGKNAEDRNWFQRLFNLGDDAAAAAQRYRLELTTDAARTRVAVQTAEGAPVTAPVGERIAQVLLEALQ